MTLKTDLLWCPISFDRFVLPVITPCGHTFNHSHLAQHLQHNATCPMDRAPLALDRVRTNRVIQDLASAVDNLTAIFITNHQQAPVFKYRCFLSRDILESPVALPCHDRHDIVMNERSLINFSLCKLKAKIGSEDSIFSKSNTNLEEYNANGGTIVCPCCDTEYKPTEVIKDQPWLVEMREGSLKEYEDFREKLRVFNSHLRQQVEVANLDDRSSIMQILSCPIAHAPLQDPVIAPCGHTFEKASVSDETICPIDQQVLKPGEMVSNIIVKKILPEVQSLFSSVFFNSADSQNINGTWLYLKKDSPINRIEQITKQLGYYTEKPRWIPLFVTSSNRNFGYDSLEDHSADIEKSPLIRRANHKLY